VRCHCCRCCGGCHFQAIVAVVLLVVLLALVPLLLLRCPEDGGQAGQCPLTEAQNGAGTAALLSHHLPLL